MTAKFKEQITINIDGRFVFYFEMDTKAFKINIKTYAIDEAGDMIDNTVKASGWLDMFQDEQKTIPNLEPADFPIFAQAMPLVNKLVYAYAKKGGVVPDAAIID